jgi:hypothetical protein
MSRFVPNFAFFYRYGSHESRKSHRVQERPHGPRHDEQNRGKATDSKSQCDPFSFSWKRYQNRPNARLTEAQWAKMFDNNLAQARRAAKKVDDYHATLGWGKREVTVKAGPGKIARRLDIADEANLKGIEYKTGYQTADASNLWEVARDRMLLLEGWDIKWVFEGRASQPLLRALDAAGIPYILR